MRRHFKVSVLKISDLMNNCKTSLIVVGIAAAIAVTMRLMNLPYMNFSALGALAVLCGAIVRPAWLGILIPLGCRLITDCELQRRTGHGFYGSMVFDYAAYAGIFALGRAIQPKNSHVALGTGLLAGLTFFLVSNFGVWCMPHEPGQYLYPHTLSGLRNCFVSALPFARGTFLGDIGFTLAFFSAIQLLAAPATAALPVTSEG